MMKTLLALGALFASVSAFSQCDSIATKIDDNYVYAEVISRSHMDLEFVLVSKAPRMYKLKVYGGEGFDHTNLPKCGEGPEADLNWFSYNIAREWTSGGSSSFSSAYRICYYDYNLTEVKRSYAVCNWETGD